MSDLQIWPATLVGMRFGRLTVISRSNGRSMWLCICDCGNNKAVRTDHLKRGATRSCGCLGRENLESRWAAMTKHGECRRSGRAREWVSWALMIQRCYDPKA